MKRLILLLLVFNQLNAQHTNVQNEVSVKNAVFFTFRYKMDEKNPNLQGKGFFKPYMFYVNESGAPLDYMMESFVLIDDYFQSRPTPDYDNPYTGIYNPVYNNNYLDDIFKRTKLPILVDDNYNGNGYKMAYIGKNAKSSLSYTIDNINPNFPPQVNNIQLKFDYKLEDNYIPNDSVVNLFIGWQYFDSLGKELNNFPGHYSGEFGTYIEDVYTIADSGTFTSSSIPIPSGVKSIKLHIISNKLGEHSSMKIDNVKIQSNGGDNLITNIRDRDFEAGYDEMTTKWEFNKIYPTYLHQSLFKNRLALLTEIKETRTIQPFSFALPTTKIILALPNFNFEYYASSQQNLNNLKDEIENFLDDIQTRMTTWNSANLNSGVEIKGVYMLQELLSDPNLEDLLSFIKEEVHQKGWELYGSPYVNTSIDENCQIENSYNPVLNKNFDVLWQQPNAFFYDFNRGYMDSQMLKYVNEFISNDTLSVNIESNFFRSEDYPMYNVIDRYDRVNDYFSYGEKYGFINYAKVFYDDSGLHYRNAYSDEDSIRKDYDNLYKFIKKARKGVVINPEFETIKNNSTNEFHNWSGSYSTQGNLFSYSAQRSFDVAVISSSSNLNSQKIPIKGGEHYILSVKARETSNDNQINSALVGVIFYNNAGNVITSTLNSAETNLNPNFNNLLNSYVIPLDTPSNNSFRDYKIYFKAPANTVKFRFYLKKNKTANLEFKNMKFEVKGNAQKFRPIYKDTGLDSLKVENEYDFGSKSLKLFYHDNLQHAGTSEKISILSNKKYKFKVWAKEKLPIKTLGAVDKALIAIETFNSSGVKTNTSLNGFQSTTINGVQYQYKYITEINQVWSEFSTDIIFPTAVASVKVHLYNWYYDNDLYFDNISFELANSSLILENLNEKELFDNNNWTEKTPLIASFQKPVFYKDLIDVSKAAKLKFTAKMRDTNSATTNNDFLAIEFYDANYNLLTNSDVSTGETNLFWNSYYKLWWSNSYFNMNSWGCNDNGEERWFNNQWKVHERDIEIPDDASFIRVSLHKLSKTSEDFLILNPRLIVIEERIFQRGLFTDQLARRKNAH